MKIKLLTLFLALCAMSAQAQTLTDTYWHPNMEHHPKKEIRGEYRPKAMRPKDFKMMCEVVKDATFSERQIGVIKVACISSYFNSKQCAELLSIFSFEKDKLQALKVLRPKMLDLNPKEIQKQFTFSSGKEEAMEIMYPDM